MIMIIMGASLTGTVVRLSCRAIEQHTAGAQEAALSGMVSIYNFYSLIKINLRASFSCTIIENVNFAVQRWVEVSREVFITLPIVVGSVVGATVAQSIDFPDVPAKSTPKLICSMNPTSIGCTSKTNLQICAWKICGQNQRWTHKTCQAKIYSVYTMVRAETCWTIWRDSPQEFSSNPSRHCRSGLALHSSRLRMLQSHLGTEARR